jgi:protein-arginine kinase activator protein McsA
MKHFEICILTKKYQANNKVITGNKQEVFVCDKCSSSERTAEITAIPISSCASAVIMGYNYKNSILPPVLLFLSEGIHV